MPKQDPLPDVKDARLLLASIVESSDDAIISKDPSGTITSWNRAAEKLFGYTAEEVIGGPISVIIPPERGAEETEILRKINRGERIEHFETQRLRKDGQLIEVAVTISPLFENGRVIGAAKIARDISQERRARSELHEHRQRLQVTLASIADGVITTDQSGNITFMNSMAETLTGWKADEAIGQAIEDVFHIIEEESRRGVENPVARALQTGQVVGLANNTILRAKNQAEYWIDDSAAPIRSGDSVLGGVLVFRDVSGPRAAQQFRARLAAIVESSSDAIISKDLHGRITSWNAAAVRMFGYTPEEVIGRPISILIPPERLVEETEILSRIRAGERVDHLETIRLTKDHRKLQVSLSISPILDGYGTVVGASKIARDITEQKRMESELLQAKERLQQHSAGLEKLVAERTGELLAAYEELETFSYAVAHDLRAPLRALRAFTELLSESLGSKLDPQQTQYLQTVVSSAARLNFMLEDLLRLSRLAKEEIQFEPVDLNQVVKGVAAELEEETKGRKVQWQFEPLPEVKGDLGLIKQVFYNLLHNALKYTRDRDAATITVGQTTIQGETVVFVRDNGIGFDSKRAKGLFKPFQRLHRESDVQGTGVGLAIVNQIVRKHGGRIWAEAEEGSGATFFIALPV